MMEQDVETSELRVCQCCLSTKVDVLSSKSNYGIVFEILSGQKLDKAEFQLCCECCHAMGKFSRFRNMSFQARKILRQFYTKQSENQQVNLELFTRKRAELNLGAKLSQSNTLCVSIEVGSSSLVQISSISHGAKPSKNFIQDMSLGDAELKEANKIEIKEENLNVENEMEFEIGIEQNNALSEHFEDDDNDVDDFENPKFVKSIVKGKIKTKQKTKFQKLVTEKKTKKGMDCMLDAKEVLQKSPVDRDGEAILVSLGPQTPGGLSCPVCRQSFWTQKDLTQHLQQHGGELHCCSDCGQNFKQAKELVKHIFVAHGIGQAFCCDKCGEKFLRKNLLVSHIRRHCAVGALPSPHTPPLPVHYCVECDRHYKSAYILRQHFRRTTRHRDPNVYRFECLSCPSLRRFRSPALLAQHTRAVHERVEQLTCHSCGGNYATLDSLQSHINKKHMGYKPPRKWACTYCDKKFRAQNVLQNHIRIHTGEKPFACGVCHDHFRQKAALDTHVRAVHLKLGARRRRLSNTNQAAKHQVLEKKTIEDKQEV